MNTHTHTHTHTQVYMNTHTHTHTHTHIYIHKLAADIYVGPQWKPVCVMYMLTAFKKENCFNNIYVSTWSGMTLLWSCSLAVLFFLWNDIFMCKLCPIIYTVQVHWYAALVLRYSVQSSWYFQLHCTEYLVNGVNGWNVLEIFRNRFGHSLH
jgi:hypothetical protein